MCQQKQTDPFATDTDPFATDTESARPVDSQAGSDDDGRRSAPDGGRLTVRFFKPPEDDVQRPGDGTRVETTPAQADAGHEGMAEAEVEEAPATEAERTSEVERRAAEESEAAVERDADGAEAVVQERTTTSLESEENPVSDVQETLNKVMESVQGAIGVALVDFDGGLTLGTAGGGAELNLEIAGAGSLEVVRAKLRTMEQLGLDDQIEDVLITLGQQYHLIRPLVSHPAMFLYLAIHRQDGNLGMARHQLRNLDSRLEI